jgi:hypothetical protein
MSSTTFTKTIAVGHAVLTVVLGSAVLLSQVLLGQTTPAARSLSTGLEFPVIMRQKVAAGKAPVGTKVQAKLAVATLVGGVVVPQGAILAGEVTESAAKSANNPSRLAIRMDSAQWTNGSAPIKVYLTAWYYPVATPTDYRRMMPGDLSSGLPDDANNSGYGRGGLHTAKHWNGTGVYPDERKPASSPLSRSDTRPAPASDISKHYVLMKNVESARNSDGAVALTSKRSNIKLDKQTTYVLAAGDLLPTK